jgi:hypothetical protein
MEVEMQPRIAGLDVEVAERMLEELGKKVEYKDEKLEPSYAGAFVARAHLRFAAGWDPGEIVTDLWYAGRCYGIDPGQHLSRFAYEQLLTRRIVPVECGILGGQLDLCKRLAAAYGLPLVTGLGGLATPELAAELKTLSPALCGQPIMHPQQLLGLAAGVYAAALASAARGYADEVKIAIQTLNKAAFRGELDDTQKAIFRRYAGLCEGLAELVAPGGRDLGKLLGDVVAVYTGYMRGQLGDAWVSPKGPTRYVDTGVLAVLGMAILTQYPLGAFPAEGETRPEVLAYADFVDAMREGREREQTTEVDTAHLLEQGRAQLDS